MYLCKFDYFYYWKEVKVIYTKAHLAEEIRCIKGNFKRIGFVPTMGALHEGHLALMRKAKADNDVLVCSIFVNPIQFNNAEDLERYPRVPEQDTALMDGLCDVLFMPSVSEMYPVPPEESYCFGLLENVMEGKHRPGHFNGVATVVNRLFEMVQPDAAYFGKKDFQQLAIIRKMVENTRSNIKIEAVDIVRENDGLAMSSRNSRLSEEARKSASFIFQTLTKARELTHAETPQEVNRWIKEQFDNRTEYKLEYAQIVNGVTLEDISDYHQADSIVICLAAWLDNVRLIDNITVK
ncbi:MAG: pantoate--beta-alanine ligase [Lentimicrobiaceae bacterium]|nr:pantoate--beta-alanine ligase [Lentimicrobiaceae bacterium]